MSPFSSLYIQKFSKFALNVNYLNMDNTKNINRLKAVLADVNQTNKWLAEQLGKDTVTVIKWCKNTTQPDFRRCQRLQNS